MSQNEIKGADPRATSPAESLLSIYGNTKDRQASDEGQVPLKDRFSHFILEKYKTPNQGDGNPWKNPMYLEKNENPKDPANIGKSRNAPEMVYHPHSKICRKLGDNGGVNTGGYAVCPLATKSPDCQTDRSWDFCNLEGWVD
jgi:hypothetical protein